MTSRDAKRHRVSFMPDQTAFSIVHPDGEAVPPGGCPTQRAVTERVCAPGGGFKAPGVGEYTAILTRRGDLRLVKQTVAS